MRRVTTWGASGRGLAGPAGWRPPPPGPRRGGGGGASDRRARPGGGGVGGPLAGDLVRDRARPLRCAPRRALAQGLGLCWQRLGGGSSGGRGGGGGGGGVSGAP